MDEASTTEKDFSGYRPGYTWAQGATVFRLYAPRAQRVDVEIWSHYDDVHGVKYRMALGADGYWNLKVSGDMSGKWYAYHITPPSPLPRNMEPYLGYVADPWSPHVTTRNHYLHYSRTLIERPSGYDWEGDEGVRFEDPRDLVIYEAHLRDFTAHPSSGATEKGTYKGFLQAGRRGGVGYLKKLGINAVEFLPLQKAARYEPPFMETTATGVSNTWNFYGRNHWGYMTSFFFAPETFYDSGSDRQPNGVSGLDARARDEFREVVKALHKEGIAVILDVVYNHVSQYDLNPLKFADKAAFFRLDTKGRYRSDSGCGNDARTEFPEFRKLIVESIAYWMTEYHIDGFRFDLAHLIDWETVDAISAKAKSINPNVVLIAEPWGGGYDPTGFSRRGWLAWNDQIRNGLKGSDPVHSKGFIFGTWQHETDRGALENYLRGTLLGASNGRFETSKTSLNYLESHDGYTLGDFIRIGLDPGLAGRAVTREEVAGLDERGAALARLAALALMVCQGAVMIHQGQEFARTKWIAPDSCNDPATGRLDHNSYEKDNATNHVDYGDLERNQDLFDYYRGLIALRNDSPALRKSPPGSVNVASLSDPLLLTATVAGRESDDPYDYLLILNGNILMEHSVELPEGPWELMASAVHASNKTLAKLAGTVIIPPTSGAVFRRKRS